MKHNTVNKKDRLFPFTINQESHRDGIDGPEQPACLTKAHEAGVNRDQFSHTTKQKTEYERIKPDVIRRRIVQQTYPED